MARPALMSEAAERLAKADPEALRYLVARLQERMPILNGTAHESEWPSYCGWVIGQLDIIRLALPPIVPIESLAPGTLPTSAHDPLKGRVGVTPTDDPGAPGGAVESDLEYARRTLRRIG